MIGVEALAGSTPICGPAEASTPKTPESSYFLKTLHNYLDEIASYFDRRASSGFVEGVNNKLKTVAQRSYGLKRVDSLFRRLLNSEKALCFTNWCFLLHFEKPYKYRISK